MPAITSLHRVRFAAALVAAAVQVSAWAHGDVTPQAVDTSTLPKLGDNWRGENPFRKNDAAIKIGTSAYNQNCARCHGLEAISGGIAPDLRKLDNECATQKDENGTGWIRNVPTNQVGRYMKELMEFLDGRHPEIAKTIAEKKALDDGIRKQLDAALKEFRGIFQAE